MSRRSSKSGSKSGGVFVQKAKSDVYTMMLALSLVAILFAILFLCLELSRYNWDYAGNNADAGQHSGSDIHVAQTSIPEIQLGEFI